ncbi:FKBP-type peptidyl-prolyl cis-trans isomerase family protein [Lyngbya aestuarii BL J]|uniref:Peptidyl-prolyl cis-trans isomerase n=1 Tax=Lyngbya aestuarii BL J TaxID=1348334 RepID=U7QPU8_9CYAN|nr:FKBP-type peptidyl-prolyl cis-trans isomerase [Lyngbya aestuarii]ERT09878.1 FKBP-type peptidyl-prolyl cis-trans isomerase family protein [Lyngbya aestuarii BL J]
MSQAEMGSKVKVHYVGKLENGAVFSSSANNEPLEFCIGEGEVLSNLEQAIMGMNPGESKIITIPAKQAYDYPDRESTVVVERQNLPADASIEVGQKVYIRMPNVHASIPAIIMEISESNVVLSLMNSSLGDEDIIFDIQLVEVR